MSVEVFPDALGATGTSVLGSGESGLVASGPESSDSVQPETPIRHAITKNISNTLFIFNCTPHVSIFPGNLILIRKFYPDNSPYPYICIREQKTSIPHREKGRRGFISSPLKRPSSPQVKLCCRFLPTLQANPLPRARKGIYRAFSGGLPGSKGSGLQG